MVGRRLSAHCGQGDRAGVPISTAQTAASRTGAPAGLDEVDDIASSRAGTLREPWGGGTVIAGIPRQLVQDPFWQGAAAPAAVDYLNFALKLERALGLSIPQAD